MYRITRLSKSVARKGLEFYHIDVPETLSNTIAAMEIWAPTANESTGRCLEVRIFDVQNNNILTRQFCR